MQNMWNAYTQLGQALRQEEQAIKELAQAQQAYTSALQVWEAQNESLVTARETAKRKAEEASQRLKSIRQTVASQLTSATPFEDLPKGLEQTRDKTLVYDSGAMLKACLAHFPWLLKVDEKALDSFISKLAYQETGDNTWRLPAHLALFMPIEVRLTYKSRISDAQVMQYAPQAVEEDTEMDPQTPIAQVH